MPRLFNNPTAADRLNDWVARRAVVRCRGRPVLGRLRSRRASRRFRAEKQPARVHVGRVLYSDTEPCCLLELS